MKVDTFEYFPVDVTEEEAKVGFRPMILALGVISCIPTDACKVVGRRLSDTDVVIKWRGSVEGEPRLHYQHIRFGFRARFGRARWPWTKIEWKHLGWSKSPESLDEFPYKFASQIVGVPFHEGSA
jgi:hypothetical protein